jgi:cyclophilin family peptidyl-prolyl cis-trans isomerase
VPSEKRARKRAQREAKLAALERQRKRRAGVRRTITIVVVLAVAVAVYFAITSGSKKKPARATHPTTTTTTTLPPGAVPTTTTVKLAGYTTSKDCPSNFKATLKKPKWSSPPPMIIDPTKSYSATVYTDIGSFTIALDAAAAPKTVNNFVFLAENHYYDCEVFHRVVVGFMDQVGSPDYDGTEGPGYQFANENVPTNGYVSGDVAMANAGANTNNSQFFVLVSSYSNDDYSLFGQVTSGMSVAQKINSEGGTTEGGIPTKLHRILSVVISES